MTPRPLPALAALALVACGPGSSGKGARVVDSGTLTSGPAATCQPGDAAVRGPEHFPSVGEALATAASGSTVTVCAGDWEVDQPVGTDAITIVGDPADAGQVTLRPPPSGGPVLQFFSSTAITVQHLTFTGATDSAIRLSETRSLTVEDCVFLDNASAVGGGAIAGSLRGDPTGSGFAIRRTHFSGNTSPRGGALELILQQDATLELADCSFTTNTAEGSGGAAWVEPVSGAANGLSVHDTVFTLNEAGDDGGAVAFTGPGTVEWVDTIAEDNQSGDAGAALALLPPFQPNASTATITGGRMARNTTPEVLSGALHLEPGWTLSATDLDLASGADDNVPKDVNVCGSYDDVVSFTVGAGGCQP